MNRYLPLGLAILLLIGGCASSKETSSDETAPFYLGAFEDFDPNQYEDVIPPVEVPETEHELPESLKSNEPARSTMTRGFRVQLFSSLSRSEANEAMQKAITWWEDQSDRKTARPPVYIEYEQPYYKVRAGNFRSRDAASRMAGKIGHVFAGAFVVPSLVEPGK
jgi:hypothetical protein